ncbi:2-dehydropantoate 2-reductase [Candidatus Sumerlaeota bacterium]|nr:2-dehydropantoate 2-reductase [Candidatus Sumerlaeota bacterium]
MRYLIFGAGAIGSVVGGLLARLSISDDEVFLIGRSPHVDIIRSRGLHINGIWGESIIKIPNAFSSPDELPVKSFDVIFITVKSYDTENAARAAAPLLSESGLMISLQNGLGNLEKISNVVGLKRTAGGRVIFGVEFPEPAHVTVTVCAEPVMLGSPENRAPEHIIRTCVDRFNQAGIPAEFTTEIERHIWAKVLYNIALNPLSTILGVNYGALLENDYTPEIMKQIIREAFAVADACGQELFWKTPEEYLDVLFNRLIPATAAHHPSMLQDIRRGKRTEIDALNGAIVRLGRRFNVETPVNATLTYLIKSLEQKSQPL